MLSPGTRLNIARATTSPNEGDDRAGVVVALGGNALSPASEAGAVEEQFRHTRESLGAVVDLAAEGHRLAIVHGNGPQVGHALLRNEASRHLVPPLPLGVVVASTAGWMGYMIQQSLENALQVAGLERQVATVITQVLVDANDPELHVPSKPIGQTMDEERARRMAAERGWSVAETGKGWRRVVPSPRPVATVEAEMIRSLFAGGSLVIAAGGGGIPVTRASDGALAGVNAVIDKDRAAAVLGNELGADTLLILTDVDAVYEGYGTPGERPLRRLEAADAARLLDRGELPTGSMAPKVEAALRFVQNGGRRAVITRLDLGREGVAGEAGTEIVAG